MSDYTEYYILEDSKNYKWKLKMKLSFSTCLMGV